MEEHNYTTPEDKGRVLTCGRQAPSFISESRMQEHFERNHCPFFYQPSKPFDPQTPAKLEWMRNEQNEAWYHTRLAWLEEGRKICAEYHQRALEDERAARALDARMFEKETAGLKQERVDLLKAIQNYQIKNAALVSLISEFNPPRKLASKIRKLIHEND